MMASQHRFIERIVEVWLILLLVGCDNTAPAPTIPTPSGGAAAMTESSTTTPPPSSAETLSRPCAEPTPISRNLFVELLEVSPAQVQAKLDQVWDQLFYGDDARQRVYYPVGSDMAYIEDIGHGDVRSEGMSYGMMIAVQMNKKEEFDRLWTWTRTYMQHQSGPRKGYFAWQLKPDGTVMDPNPASDGEAWFAMALFFAAGRWGRESGGEAYRAEAQTILDTMLHKAEDPENKGVMTNMFDASHKQVVFVPTGQAATFTDPSYHLPHFYELWGLWASQDNQFWCEAAAVSRQFWAQTAHPQTGLMPDYAQFDGTPTDPWGGGHADFRFDAWRTTANVAVDYSWFQADLWAQTHSKRILDFFQAEGMGQYGNQYQLDGSQLAGDHSLGLVATNAVAGLAATDEQAKPFVAELWQASVPTGQWRYYDGLLYYLALLQVSGNFRIYEPTGS